MQSEQYVQIQYIQVQYEYMQTAAGIPNSTKFQNVKMTDAMPSHKATRMSTKNVTSVQRQPFLHHLKQKTIPNDTYECVIFVDSL